MKEIERLIKKIIKKVKDKDATYIYGVEYSNETKPSYKALIKFSKQGVSPVIVATNTEEKLIEALDSYLMGSESKDINIMYHEGQIELEKQAIKFHEGFIRDYQEDKEVNEITPSELPE